MEQNKLQKYLTLNLKLGSKLAQLKSEIKKLVGKKKRKRQKLENQKTAPDLQVSEVYFVAEMNTACDLPPFIFNFAYKLNSYPFFSNKKHPNNAYLLLVNKRKQSAANLMINHNFKQMLKPSCNFMQRLFSLIHTQTPVSQTQELLYQASVTALAKQCLQLPISIGTNFSKEMIAKFQGSAKFLPEEVVYISPDISVFKAVTVYSPFTSQKFTRNKVNNEQQKQLRQFFGLTFNLRQQALSDVYTLIHKQQGEIIGALSFIVVEIHFNTFIYIFQQKTADQHTHQGIGKTLVNKVKQYATLLKNKNTYREVYLLVSASQVLQPCNFYEKQGFVFATAANDLELLQLQQFGAVLMIYPWPLSSENTIHNQKTNQNYTNKKRKSSTPTDILRQQIHELENKYHELEARFQMTDAELQKIKETSLKRQKIASLSDSSINTTQININLKINYSPIFLNTHSEFKLYLKKNAKHFTESFQPFGLQNLGQTCYLNSSLQLLQHLNHLLTHIPLFQYPQVSAELYQRFISPDKILNSQQDAHEYMTIIYESCKHLKALIDNKTQKIIKCENCQHILSAQIESQWSLQIPVKQSVQVALESYFGCQLLDGYYCDNCKMKSSSTSQQTMKVSNEILVLHLMRFNNNTQQKNNLQIEVQNCIKLNQDLYELYGYITHIGENLNSGHYVYCYRDELQWKVIDDNNVFKLKNITQENDKNMQHNQLRLAHGCTYKNQGYIYLYKKINSSCSHKRKDGVRLNQFKVLERGSTQNIAGQDELNSQHSGKSEKIINMNSLFEKQRMKKLTKEQQAFYKLQDGFFKIDNTNIMCEKDQLKRVLGKRHYLQSQLNLSDCDTPVQSSQSSIQMKRTKSQRGMKRNSHEITNQNKKNTEGRKIRKLQCNSIVQFLRTGTVSEYITDFDEVFDNFFKNRNTQDKHFERIGSVFCDGIIIPDVGIFKETPMANLKLIIDKHLNVKSMKLSERKDGSYFIRVNDENSTMNGEFIFKIAKLMKELRSQVRIFWSSQLNDADEIQSKVNQIYLLQLDHTSHLKGLLYTLFPHDSVQALSVLLNYDIAPHSRYRQMKSCLQLIQCKQSSNKTKSVEIQRRLKFYNKFPLHLLQTEALNKLISMGFKALLYCSHTFYQTLLQCVECCLSRMEFSEFFGSISEEEDFLNNENLEQQTQLHQQTIDKVNNDSIVSDLYKEATIKEVLDIFWASVKETVIIRTQDEACVIYGFNKNTSKYYGMLEPIQHNKQINDLVAHHALSGGLCVGVELYEKGRVVKTKHKKCHKSKVQYPVAPLCHNHKQQYSFAFLGMEEHGFTYKLNKKEMEIETISTFTNISHNQKTKIDKDHIFDISNKYSQHNALIQSIDKIKATISVHLIAFSRNKTLTLYDSFNNVKYQQVCSHDQFARLPKHLRLLWYKKYKNMYVNYKGVKYQEIEPLLTIVMTQIHTQSLPTIANRDIQKESCHRGEIANSQNDITDEMQVKGKSIIIQNVIFYIKHDQPNYSTFICSLCKKVSVKFDKVSQKYSSKGVHQWNCVR